MTTLTDLIDTALRAAQSKATAASIWSDNSKEHRAYAGAYDEARATLAAAVELVEKDAVKYNALKNAGYLTPEEFDAKVTEALAAIGETK